MAKTIWFDTHSHLQDKAFASDRDQVFQRAKDAGVEYILLATSNIEDSRVAAELALEHQNVYCSIGIHPQEAGRWDQKSAQFLKKIYRDIGKKAKRLGRDNPIKAIGEIGLDYHWDNDPREVQKFVYKEQIRLANELNLPVIIHEREAYQDSYDILEWAYNNGLLKDEPGVSHCFSGSWQGAQRLIKLGFTIGLDGPVTFKNARKAKEIAAKINLEKLLLETDAPYLTPEPYRGKRNESSYLPYIGKVVAELRNAKIEDIAKQTLINGKRVFSIK
ncbi:MAG: TatD family hydrolase [Clostridiaceae bacterium]|nr:TatD family hydrolase [Clostridiaceae bacterium]